MTSVTPQESIEVRGKNGTSLSQAQQHLRETSVLDLDDNGNYKPFPICNTGMEQLGRYGVGIELYFRFVKGLVIVFFIMTIAVGPMLFFNSFGSQIGDSGTEREFKLDYASLANYASGNATQITLKFGSLYTNTVPLEQAGLAVTFSDLAMCALFLLFVYVFKSTQSKVVEENDESNVTVTDYAVEILSLPRDGVNSSDLASHFQQFGTVVEACVARRFNGVIGVFLKKANVMRNLDREMAKMSHGSDSVKASATKKADGLYKRIQDIENKIREDNPAKKTFDDLECERAYVVFNEESARLKCLNAYRFSHITHLRIFSCCQKRRYRWKQTKSIYVRPAPAPSSVLWENLEISDGSRRMRRMLTTFLIIVLLFVSAGIIFAAKKAQDQVPKAADCKGRVVTYQANLNGTAKDCFCESIGISNILSDSKYRTFCSDWVIARSTAQGITFLSSVVIIAVNGCFGLFLKLLANLEAHKTVSSRTSKIVLGIFLAQFLNTAIVVLAINANFTRYFSLGDLNNFLFSGQYADFDQSWYLTVGTSVTYTMLINVVSPHVVGVLMIPLTRCRRRSSWASKWTQRDLNDFFTGPPFDIAVRYASLLNTVFVTLLYSSGIPILIPIACVCFFIKYWCDKILFLRHCTKPPNYDQKVSELVLNALPFAVVLHLAFAVWMMGQNQYVVDSSISMNLVVLVQTLAGRKIDSLISDDRLGSLPRVIKMFPTVAFLVALVLLIVLSKILLTVLRQVWFLVSCKCIRGSAPVAPVSHFADTFQEMYETIKANDLPTYDIRQNPSYKDAIIAYDV